MWITLYVHFLWRFISLPYLDLSSPSIVNTASLSCRSLWSPWWGFQHWWWPLGGMCTDWLLPWVSPTALAPIPSRAYLEENTHTHTHFWDGCYVKLNNLWYYVDRNSMGAPVSVIIGTPQCFVVLLQGDSVTISEWAVVLLTKKGLAPQFLRHSTMGWPNMMLGTEWLQGNNIQSLASCDLF